jgi:hypothetical protein
VALDLFPFDPTRVLYVPGSTGGSGGGGIDGCVASVETKKVLGQVCGGRQSQRGCRRRLPALLAFSGDFFSCCASQYSSSSKLLFFYTSSSSSFFACSQVFRVSTNLVVAHEPVQRALVVEDIHPVTGDLPKDHTAPRLALP